MPITSSAKKALRQNKRRRAQNVARQDALKTAIKSYKKLLAEKKGDPLRQSDSEASEAKAALAKVYQALDKAAKTNAISRNKASRLKSRLAVKLSPPAPRTPSNA